MENKDTHEVNIKCSENMQTVPIPVNLVLSNCSAVMTMLLVY